MAQRCRVARRAFKVALRQSLPLPHHHLTAPPVRPTHNPILLSAAACPFLPRLFTASTTTVLPTLTCRTMKWFSRKKKGASSTVPAAASSATPVQPAVPAEAVARAAAVDQRRAEERRKQEEVKQIEQHNVDAITAKEKQIAMIEKALKGFEEHRQREAKLALRARQMKKTVDTKMHLRQAKRFETRIAQHETMLAKYQDQLAALQDVATHRQQTEANKKFAEQINTLALDVDEVDDVLQEQQAAIEKVQNITTSIQADSTLNPASTEMMDMEAELDALEAEFSEPAVTAIPPLPDTTPAMPAVSLPTATSTITTEEDDIRRLEQQVAL